MKIERLKLSKPYPIFRIALDGKDIVLSILSFYIRLKG